MSVEPTLEVAQDWGDPIPDPALVVRCEKCGLYVDDDQAAFLLTPGRGTMLTLCQPCADRRAS